ncbi:3'-5' exoribonuclease [Bacillus sp. sid0103]|uniref:exonuclease domain-containing protein n=1 Tax=Bacillus sp. sid0103 TaxID=2856337 RepID=UPI001C4792D1|nr:exonuclease domain-containing protein [Bacillus sp. sid0103]MBV7508322.1 3'-5' exoribonuclease [Bacillus sp. sid0103]
MKINDLAQYFRQISGKVGSNIYAGIQGQVNPQHLSFIRQLQKEMKGKNNLETPLNELEVVVFDLETTGFYPEKGDYVLSIGAVKMVGQQIEANDTFYSLIKSDLPLTEEIAALTRIDENQLRDAPHARDVLLQFFNFAQSHILVAHHSKHEKSFMQKMTWDLLKTRFEHRIIDTSFLIRLSDTSVKSLPLEELCHECGIAIKNRHHALGDALMTAQIWGNYLQRAQKNGYSNLREVYEHLAKL